ncbi:AF4/FMR2 family member 1 isoform X4 [Corythoichthys intestinalis]|uniref:AF4/FMR2 family member 1 isoform X4 n=1 Tax=Corythoichthys intestinalis TaxID=161448 RepID=UPI0025A5597E|nr:AF4/FMR2 family member 1 isoform X4 [Corythoichthys intestinalis]
MASQPSIYDERNRLRLRAWEQRNQETSQAKELWAENVPLFGHPYKINKGDELSHRIQRMLGSFEDADNPATSPANFTQSDRGRPNSDRSDKPPVLDSDGQISSRNFSCSSYVFQATREKKPSSPNHRGSVKSSLDQHKQVETLSDWVENARSPQERVTRSPDGWPIVFPNPSEPVGATDRFEPRRESASTSATADISAINPKHSPADPSPYQAGKSGHSLLSQSFPPLSSSKPPSVVAMQKPTAYVRPMDGQDLLLGGSPNLKPSTEPHVPLQEILKPERAKTKMLETKANEGVCVQAILKEMTHSWPPLLTAIHIPNSDGCLTKEVGQVSSCPGGQKSHQHSPGHLDTQSSSLSVKLWHRVATGSWATGSRPVKRTKAEELATSSARTPAANGSPALKPFPQRPAGQRSVAETLRKCDRAAGVLTGALRTAPAGLCCRRMVSNVRKI